VSFNDDIAIDIDVRGDAAARRDLDRVGDSATNLGGSFTGMGGKAKAAGALVVTAVAGMALEGAMQMATMGLELDLMGKRVDTVFGDQAADINAWASEVNRSMGTSAQRVAGLTANVGDLLIPLGFTREQAAGMSQDVLTTASALDLWSTSTNSVEEATEILNAALLGERERLKGLGISLTQAELDAAMLERGLGDLEGQERKLAEATVTLELVQKKSADAMTFASSEGAEQQLVVRDLQARWAELRDNLAEKFLPIAISVGEKILDIADWISSDAVPAARAFWEEIEPLRDQLAQLWDQLTWVAEKLAILAGEILDVIVPALGAFVDGINFVVDGIGGIVGAVDNFLFGEGIGDQLKREAHDALIAAGEFDAAAAIYENAANRINASTSKRKARETEPLVPPTYDIPDVPPALYGYNGPGSLQTGGVFAMGGLVPARTGGTQITVGEAGEDEYVIPASRLAGMFGRKDDTSPKRAAPAAAHLADLLVSSQPGPGPTMGAPSTATTVNYTLKVAAGMGADGGNIGAEVIEHIRNYERRNGATWRAA